MLKRVTSFRKKKTSKTLKEESKSHKDKKDLSTGNNANRGKAAIQKSASQIEDRESDGVKALVLWKYVPEQDDEIALQKGDIITVYEQDDSGWWTGETNEGNYGLFPGKFVKVLEDTKSKVNFNNHSAPEIQASTNRISNDASGISRIGDLPASSTSTTTTTTTTAIAAPLTPKSTSTPRSITVCVPETSTTPRTTTPRTPTASSTTTTTTTAAASTTASTNSSENKETSESGAALALAERRIKELQSELEIAKDHRERTKQKYKTSKKKCQELTLEKELREWQGEMEKEPKANGGVEKGKSQLEKSAFEVQKASFEKERQTFKEEKDQLEKQNQNLKQEIIELKSRLETVPTNELTALKRQLQDEVAKLRSQLLESERKADLVADLELQLSQSKKSLASESLEREKLQTQLNHLKHGSTSSVSFSSNSSPTIAKATPTLVKSSSKGEVYGMKSTPVALVKSSSKGEIRTELKVRTPSGGDLKGKMPLDPTKPKPAAPKGDKPIREVIDDVHQRFNTNVFLSGEGKKLKQTGMEKLN